MHFNQSVIKGYKNSLSVKDSEVIKFLLVFEIKIKKFVSREGRQNRRMNQKTAAAICTKIGMMQTSYSQSVPKGVVKNRINFLNHRSTIQRNNVIMEEKSELFNSENIIKLPEE